MKRLRRGGELSQTISFGKGAQRPWRLSKNILSLLLPKCCCSKLYSSTGISTPANRLPAIIKQSPSNLTEKSTSLSIFHCQHHWLPIINMIRLGRLLGRWPSTTSAFRFAGTKATEVTHHKDHHEEDHDHDDDHGHHGHHEKPYDWRDDFSKNPEYSQDILNRGCRHPSTYHYPHDAPAMKWAFSHPENYDQKDLTKNFVQVKHIGPITNKLRVP